MNGAKNSDSNRAFGCAKCFGDFLRRLFFDQRECRGHSELQGQTAKGVSDLPTRLVGHKGICGGGLRQIVWKRHLWTSLAEVVDREICGDAPRPGAEGATWIEATSGAVNPST